jgi:hypothetical protein
MSMVDGGRSDARPDASIDAPAIASDLPYDGKAAQITGGVAEARS